MEVYNEKSFLDFFKALIRYLASGFIFIIVYKYLEHDTSIWSFTKDNMNWTLVFVAAICGLLIYSIHVAFLDDFFYRLSLWWLVKKKADKDFYLPSKFEKAVEANGHRQFVSLSRIMFDLTTDRYMREGQGRQEMIGLQNRLDQLLTFLVFLYTSCYSLLLLPIVFAVKSFNLSTFTFTAVDENFYTIELLGILLLVSGFALDLKITKRELFTVKEMNEDDKTTAIGSSPESMAKATQPKQL